MAIQNFGEINGDAGTSQLVVTESLDIYCAQRMQEFLDGVIRESSPNLAIDLSAVEDIDSSGIQLLLALNQQLKSQNKTLTITQCSSEVKTLFSLYQIERYIQLEDNT